MPQPQPRTDDTPAHPDAGMIRDGAQEGSATVRFSKDRKQNYHLDSKGERVYHAVPDGYRFTPKGELESIDAPKGEKAEDVTDG